MFWAIEVANDAKVNGNDFAYALMKLGLLTKATHDFSLRLAPALIIKEQEVLYDTYPILELDLEDLERKENEFC